MHTCLLRGRSEDSDCRNRVHAVACVCMRRQCGSSVWICDRVHESVRVRHLALDQHRFANWSRAWPAPTDITERSCSSCYADWFRLAGRNTDLIAYTCSARDGLTWRSCRSFRLGNGAPLLGWYSGLSEWSLLPAQGGQCLYGPRVRCRGARAEGGVGTRERGQNHARSLIPTVGAPVVDMFPF